MSSWCTLWVLVCAESFQIGIDVSSGLRNPDPCFSSVVNIQKNGTQFIQISSICCCLVLFESDFRKERQYPCIAPCSASCARKDSKKKHASSHALQVRQVLSAATFSSRGAYKRRSELGDAILVNKKSQRLLDAAYRNLLPCRTAELAPWSYRDIKMCVRLWQRRL